MDPHSVPCVINLRKQLRISSYLVRMPDRFGDPFTGDFHFH